MKYIITLYYLRKRSVGWAGLSLSLDQFGSVRLEEKKPRLGR